MSQTDPLAARAQQLAEKWYVNNPPTMETLILQTSLARVILAALREAAAEALEQTIAQAEKQMQNGTIAANNLGVYVNNLRTAIRESRHD